MVSGRLSTSEKLVIMLLSSPTQYTRSDVDLWEHMSS